MNENGRITGAANVCAQRATRPGLKAAHSMPTALKKSWGMSEDNAPVIAYGKLPNQFNFHSSVESHVA